MKSEKRIFRVFFGGWGYGSGQAFFFDRWQLGSSIFKCNLKCASFVFLLCFIFDRLKRFCTYIYHYFYYSLPIARPWAPSATVAYSQQPRLCILLICLPAASRSFFIADPLPNCFYLTSFAKQASMMKWENDWFWESASSKFLLPLSLHSFAFCLTSILDLCLSRNNFMSSLLMFLKSGKLYLTRKCKNLLSISRSRCLETSWERHALVLPLKKAYFPSVKLNLKHI